MYTIRNKLRNGLLYEENRDHSYQWVFRHSDLTRVLLSNRNHNYCVW